MNEFFIHEGGKTMYIVFLALILIFFITISVLGALDKKKSRGIVLTEKMRCKDYYNSIALLWGAVLVVFILCFIGKISLLDIGFRLISFKYNIWFTVVTLILSGLLFAIISYQTILLLTSAKSREEAKKQIVDGEGAANMLPRTKKEKRLFSFLSFSAGVCEEIIFRGFLMFLLLAIFPDIPIYFIILIPSIIFGIGHLYQGLQGVIKTGVFGALLMCLFLVTDSLLLAIVLHFLADLSSAFLLSEKDIENSKSEIQ